MYKRQDVEFDKKILGRKDEVGDLTKAIQHLQKELQKIIKGIKESTDMLMEASNTCLLYTSRCV